MLIPAVTKAILALAVGSIAGVGLVPKKRAMVLA